MGRIFFLGKKIKNALSLGRGNLGKWPKRTISPGDVRTNIKTLLEVPGEGKLPSLPSRPGRAVLQQAVSEGNH